MVSSKKKTVICSVILASFMAVALTACKSSSETSVQESTQSSNNSVVSEVATSSEEPVSSGEEQSVSYGVVGTVNGEWDTDTVMSDEDGDGIYTAQLTLEPGSYEWKVRANGAVVVD